MSCQARVGVCSVLLHWSDLPVLWLAIQDSRGESLSSMLACGRT